MGLARGLAKGARAPSARVESLIRSPPKNVDSVHVNWTHSGAVMRTAGFVWIAAAILVVTGASVDVWLACGIAATSLGLASALHSYSLSRSRLHSREASNRYHM